MATPKTENDKPFQSPGQPAWRSRIFSALFFVLLFAGLYRVSLSHYLLFHALIEFPSIIVAFSIFVIGWNSRPFVSSNLLVFFSIFFLPVSILDFLHTLSYKGSGFFPVDGANLATQYWIAARYLQAGSCLTVAVFIKQMDRFKPEKLLPVFLFLSAGVALLIFPLGHFPDCYLEGSGLTAFKIWSEIIICIVLAASFFLIWRRRRYWDQYLLIYFFPFILLFIFSELSFTLYKDVYGFFNFLGHILKFASYVCIYLGLIEGSLKRPYSLLFRDLVDSEKKLLKELRERQVAEKQAIQARNEARNANETKSRFLANIAHEIRTPLNAILGLTELTLATDIKGESKGYVRMLRSAGVSLRGLVDNVLDMSKIEEGKFGFFVQPFDLRPKIDDIIKLLDVLAREKGVKLVSAVADDIPQVLEGDQQRLRQVLTNLIVNAIKFTKEGEISLSVTCSPNQDGGEKSSIWLEFRVQDTGIGIPKERIKDLFKKYSQIESPFSREYTGSGLGLAISREIVEKMGGTIGVESREGEGSTFHFSIPFQIAPAEFLPRGREKTDILLPTAALKTSSEEAPVKVLLVEDDLINRKVMSWMLAQKSYLVEAVSDGAEAVEKTASENYDCILMDLRMPTMDGIAATKAIRVKWPKDREPVRIIGFSASPFEEERKRCLDAGMDDYLSKPVHWHALFGKINQCRKNQTPQPKLPEGKDVDFSDLILAVGENRRALANMIDEFLEASPERLQDIIETVAAGDASSLERKAHGLKSAVGIWGDCRAFDILSELEEAGRTDDFGHAEKLVKNLPEEVENLKLALTDLRSSL